MWSTSLLFLLVGLAYASHNPGWQENIEYVYDVSGRTLVSLDQISSNYSGIIIRAQLSVRPRSDGNLGAKVIQAEYAKVFTQLKDGSHTNIPESELSFVRLPLSQRPFKLVMKKGAVRDLIVESSIANWEANILKGVISPFQLDTNAVNVIPSSINLLREEGENNAVYKTMEETVSAVSETLYEIHPIPKYLVDYDDFVSVEKDADYIEILKTKNYTHSEEAPAYYFGFEGFEGFGVDNNIGSFFSRNTATRALVTGSLDKFTLQESVTEDVIYVRPAMSNSQFGSLISVLNVTLRSTGQQNQQFDDVSQPIHAGLVYSYDQPFELSNQPRQSNGFNHEKTISSAEASDSYVYPRRLSFVSQSGSGSSSSSSDSSEFSEEGQYPPIQKQPKLSEAPDTPLLPLYVGFNGQAFSKKHNVKDLAIKLAQQIGQDWQQTQEISKQNTVGKFLMLTNLIKLMNENEIGETAKLLDPKKKDLYQQVTCVAFRDAAAQAGTGPVLLNIGRWIKDYLCGLDRRDAADLIASAAKFVRQPTEDYMEKFYEMLEDEDLMKKKYVNESAILSFTTLVRQVYVDKTTSHDKYPVHSFGSFRTLKGIEFVQKKVIPYLTRHFEQAIEKADSHKIHIYIRALGNVGDKKILQVFQPYLEGKKQASNFQRLLMVLALEPLGNIHKKVARAVFYRIYQNENEDEDVRVAAVYQLMRTSPSPVMLQRMAINTKYDPNSCVNSVVKSVIGQAENLKDPRFAKLRSAAQSARPFLTEQEYGIQFSQDLLRNYILGNMEATYTQIAQSYCGKDSVWPKGMDYIFSKHIGGNGQQIVRAQGMVSSVEDLVFVLQQQTKEFQRLVLQKQQQQSSNKQWSSEYTAKTLHEQNSQREQLEASLFLQLGRFQKIWSFDNTTIENIKQDIEDWEQQLDSGKKIEYSSMFVAEQSVISLPTVWGLPFIYSDELPVLVGAKGEVSGRAQPNIASQGGIEQPQTVEAEYKISAFVSGRVQSEFGFFTPFDSQRYSAGYDKNMHVELPEISGKFQLNVKNKQARFEFESPDPRQNIKLLHLSTRPYTTKYDIYGLYPKKEIIRSENPHQFNGVFGPQSTGIGLSIHVSSDEPLNLALLYDKFKEEKFTPAVLRSILDENLQNIEINVGLDSAKSTAKKVVFQLGHQQKTPNRNDLIQSDIRHDNKIAQESFERQQEFLKKIIAEGNNIEAHVVDAVVQFEGQKTMKYTKTFAGAKNYADSKSSYVLQAQKHVEGSSPKQVYVSASCHGSKSNGLNLNQEMKIEPTIQGYFKASIDTGNGNPSQINADIVFSKSQNRKQYLMEHPDYKACQLEMEHDNNYQMPVCAKVTAQASLLDQFAVNIEYKNVESRFVNRTYQLYSFVRQSLIPRVSEDIINIPQGYQNRLDIQGQLSPDLSLVNVSLNTAFGRVEVKDVPVNKWYRSILSPHPTYNAFARLSAEAYKINAFRPDCVIDNNAVNTFDNKTYPIGLSHDWTVLLQYVPSPPSPGANQPEQSVQQQLNELDEGYIVYTRASQIDSSQKEIKIVFQSPETSGELVDIILQPSESSQYPAVLVNSQPIQLEQVPESYAKFLQVYPLPNNVVKVVIYDAFSILYDGIRAKADVPNSKFRDASRGLCGTFTGEPETDFTSPANCILHDPQLFVDSWTLSKTRYTPPIINLHYNSLDAGAISSRFGGSPHRPVWRIPSERHCYQKNVKFVRVVAPQDLSSDSKSMKMHQSYTKYQTQYKIQGDKTCFTLRPLAVCKEGARPHGSVYKLVPVHCVKSTAATELWRSKIDAGASPDFSNKRPNRSVMMMVPRRCMP